MHFPNFCDAGTNESVAIVLMMGWSIYIVMFCVLIGLQSNPAAGCRVQIATKLNPTPLHYSHSDVAMPE